MKNSRANELIKNEKYGLVVSSRTIAKELGKRHDHIIRDLEKILETPNLGSLIISSNYRVSTQKREYKEYLLTKNGFILYMFNIQGYNDFKMAYINKFDEMEKQLQQKSLKFEFNEINYKDYDRTLNLIKVYINNLKMQLVHDRKYIDLQIERLDRTGLTNTIEAYTQPDGKIAVIQDL